MKKSFWNPIVVLTVFGLALLSQANDDLLSILESDTTESLVQERDEVTMALKSILKSPTAEQNIFLEFLGKSQYDKSLFQWWPAFKGTEFAGSETGHALFGYLLIKSGMKVIGVERLFQAKAPQNIAAELMKVIKLELPAKDMVWRLASVEWRPAWTAILGETIEVRVKAHRRVDLSKIDETYELLKKSQVGSEERAWLEWQMVLGLALKGDTGKAGKVLAHLLKSKNSPLSPDLLMITAARMLFEKGYLSPAIGYYQKVPKSSEYWFVAQEELAWSYIRKGEPQNTLAVTQSLMVPDFKVHVGPEVLFLRALSQLKVCDYMAVSETLSLFRKRFKTRAISLVGLTKNPEQEATQRLVKFLKMGPVTLIGLGVYGKVLPQFVSRDDLLMAKVKALVEFEKEADRAEKLYTQSLSKGSAQVGFQRGFADFKQQVQKRQQAQLASVYKLIQDRAEQEIKDIRQVLSKMHIVEAEVLQQVSMAKRVIANATGKMDERKGTTGSKGQYNLKFPFDGETWFDELTNYKIDIKKGCQARRK